MSAKRRKQKNTRALNPPLNKPQETAAARPPQRVIAGKRKWLFRLAVMMIPVVLFFGLLEIGLRVGGYGYPTAFFVGPDAHGTYTTNYRFGWRFFPSSLAREPHPCFISAKPAGAVRIFVLGSSAAQGVPDPSFSFGRILEVMLREKYPQTRFEVVNAAMTAINSHVALEIAKDCAIHQPDLFIVYMGNNEVVGPYGPGTVFQQWSPNLRLVRASIWVKSTRVGQLIGDVMGYFRSKKGPSAQWQGMEMFMGNQAAADDPRLARVYENYRRNLLDICGIAQQAGAGVILSTVATNLRDCPPLASLHRSDLNAEGLEKWNSIYQDGIGLESNKQWPEAIAKFEAAARIDDRFADLQFRFGRCLAETGRFSQARDRFILARDLDALRFRADSRINEVIREVAAEQKAAGVRLADAEQALAESELAPDGILGGDLFYEHVHLTFAGNYLLARAVLDQVCEALPEAVRSGKTEPVPSIRQCGDALVLTPWDEYQMADKMADLSSRPPFTNQLEHAIRQKMAQEQVKNLRRLAAMPQALQAALGAYEAALRQSPDDQDLHYRYAILSQQAGRPDTAVEQLQIVVQKQPWSSWMHYKLGLALEKCKRIDEAIVQYRKALEIEPDSAVDHYDLGILLAGRGQIDEAIAHLQKVLEIEPDSAEAHCNLGVFLAGRGQIDAALAHLKKAQEIKPDYAEAYVNLGVVLARGGRIDEAIAHYEKALEIKPDYAEAHANLGVVLADHGRIDEAVAHLQKALKIKPDHLEAHVNLGVVLAKRGQVDEAIAHLRKALELKPDYAEAHNMLGKVLISAGQNSGSDPPFRTCPATSAK